MKERTERQEEIEALEHNMHELPAIVRAEVGQRLEEG